MKLKPIRSERELLEAREVLAQLMNDNTQGQRVDEIDVQASLIEHFEATHLPIDAPDPISAIRFRMAESGLAPRDLEPYIGSRARVSEVLSGKRSLSLDMIRSLHVGLRIPYESLIEGARSRGSARPSESAFADSGLNSTPPYLDYTTELTSRAGPVVDRMALALHRRTRTQRAAQKTDQGSLLLWQTEVARKAGELILSVPYSPSSLSANVLRKIAMLSSRRDGPEKAIETLRGLGVLTVFVPAFSGTFLDGAAFLDERQAPIIGLTLRNDRLDSFWFTLLHELAHIYLHFDVIRVPRAIFVDDIGVRAHSAEESQADELARTSLIPDSILSQVRWDKYTTADEIYAVASRARVNASVVAGRWQRDFQNYRKFSRLIEKVSFKEVPGS
jgi:HTH-type transcriptional regulator/antitoxin HigA